MRRAGLALALGALVAGGALLYGYRRWQAATDRLLASLESNRAGGGRYDEGDLDGLPAPVVRYFRRALQPGQRLITRARLEQEGSFRMSESDSSWRPFTATETFTGRPPGFVWEARIRMAPAMTVHVRDGYVAGAGSMRAEILALIPVANLSGTPEIAAGALQRYLAEAVWLPTALLPGQGVVWGAVDGRTAVASLTDGAASVTLEFRFDDEGLVESVFTPARHREVQGAFVETPWKGRFGDYAEADGMLVPREGEVEWQLPEGSLPYWRGRLTGIAYEYAP